MLLVVQVLFCERRTLQVSSMALGASVFVHDASLSQPYTYFRESMFVEHGDFCWWIFVVRGGGLCREKN